jgi:hypothetical protein
MLSIQDGEPTHFLIPFVIFRKSWHDAVSHPFRRVPAPLIRACCRDCRRHHEGVQRLKPGYRRRRTNCVRHTAASLMMKRRRGDALSAYHVAGPWMREMDVRGHPRQSRQRMVRLRRADQKAHSERLDAARYREYARQSSSALVGCCFRSGRLPPYR